MCRVSDRVVAAAGGLPAEVTANWRTLGIGTVDVEFGFSCMGYEISGRPGIAQLDDDPESDTIVFVGDGSYLLLNGDLYSAVITDKKLIVILLNNGGFAVIDKLQTGKGNASYNNLFVDTPTATRMARSILYRTLEVWGPTQRKSLMSWRSSQLLRGLNSRLTVMSL